MENNWRVRILESGLDSCGVCDKNIVSNALSILTPEGFTLFQRIMFLKEREICNMKEISDEMNNLVIPGMQNDFEDVSLKVISKNIKEKLSLIKHISYTVDLSDSKKINIHTELLPIYKVVI